jgi:hypothetical protein
MADDLVLCFLSLSGYVPGDDAAFRLRLRLAVKRIF